MSLKAIKILNDIHTILFPKVCFGCNASLVLGERYLCTVCRHKLPLTYFHRVEDNPIVKIFYGRFPLKSATSFLFFEKGGIVQQIMHYLKYKNQESISPFLGDWMGEELKEIHSFVSVDVVIPVPLHKNKLRKRGYNQVAGFGKQLAKHLEAVYVDDILVKSSKTQTQTFKDRVTRWYQNKPVFKITNTTVLQNKHILLVDDIITTGATIEACANALNNIPGITISVATMAYTK